MQHLTAIQDAVKHGYRELVSTDERGTVWQVILNGHPYLITYTIRGEVRGGDSFTSPFHVVVLQGRVIWVEERLCTTCPDGKVENTIVLKIGDEYTLDPNTPYMMVSFEESCIVTWLDDIVEPQPHPPFKTLVEAPLP